MNRTNWQKHITIDPDIHHGDACIKGTRIPAAIIVGSLADGMTIKEILAAYPQLSTPDVLATLAYAADILQQDTIVPLVT